MDRRQESQRHSEAVTGARSSISIREDQALSKTTFWVGLESDHAPHGYGEDYREYVVVDDGDDKERLLQAAVLRIAKQLTNLSAGDRIAIRRY